MEYFVRFYGVVLVMWLGLSPSLYAQSKLCTGVLGDPIIMKDFGSGSSVYNNNVLGSQDYGFYTSFDFHNRARTNDGMYSFVNRIPADFTIQNTNVWHTGQDHTPNDVDGYMMLVNADASRGEFYRDTVTGLCMGGTYEFSSYLANIFRPSNAFPNGLNSIAPRVKFEIRDMAGVVLDSINTGNIPNSAALNWQKYGITFVAPATSVVLVMISASSQGIGNDIVLDDIAFRPCTPATISITPTVQVCEGANATFTVRVEGNADYKYSRWQSSSDGVVWNYIGNVITQTSNALNYTVDLFLTNLPFSEDSTRYRLILSTTVGNLDDVDSKCNVFSPISWLRVYQYPILSITDPAPVCGLTVDLTAPAVVLGSTLRSGTLSYYKTLAEALAGTNSLSTNQAKAIAVSGQYFIKAATPTNPSCTVVEAVDVRIVSPRTLSLSQPPLLCKNNAVFTVTATTTQVNQLSWTKVGTASEVLFSGAGNSLQVVPTAADLALDSLWIKAASIDDASVCPNVKDSVKVRFRSLPQIALPADTQICYQNVTLQFRIPLRIDHASGISFTSRLGTLSKVASDTLNYSFGQNVTAPLVDSVAVVASNSPCPVSTDYMLVRYIPKPFLQAQNDTTACTAEQRITVKAVSQHTGTYQWTASTAGSFNNPTALTTSFDFSALHADTLKFWIEATSPSCGSLIDSLVYVYERPIAVKASHTVSCIADRSTVLQGTVSDGVQNGLPATWKSSGTGTFVAPLSTTSNTYIPSILDQNNGSVSLTFGSTGQKICPNKDTTLVYTIHPLPVAEAGPDTAICAGDGFSRQVASNPKFTYSWATKRKGILTDGVSLTTAIALVPDTNVRVFLTLTNAIGCMAKDSFDVAVVFPPSITLPQHLCWQEGLSLAPVLGTTPTVGTYIWTKDRQVLNSGTAVSSLSLSAIGNYKLQYVNGSCKSQDSTLVTALPTVKLEDKMNCVGANVTLHGPKMSKYQYVWNNLPVSTVDSLVFVATAQEATIHLKVQDSLGCQNRDSAKVLGVPFPEFQLSATNICIGDTGKVLAQLQDPSLATQYTLKYQWSLNQSPIAIPTWNTLSFKTGGTYGLALSIGDCRVARETKVLVHPLPEIQMQGEYVYCNEDEQPLRIQANQQYRHFWYEGNRLIANAASLDVSPQVPTNYRLEAETEFGCKSSKPVSVDICCPPRLYVPNVITPFSKDQNAYMNIFGANFTDFELTVFNRWGEIIYQTQDPKAAWDGSYRNEEMPIGVYPWMITYNATCPMYRGDYKLKGDVTIVK